MLINEWIVADNSYQQQFSIGTGIDMFEHYKYFSTCVDSLPPKMLEFPANCQYALSVVPFWLEVTLMPSSDSSSGSDIRLAPIHTPSAAPPTISDLTPVLHFLILVYNLSF
jgi:hypothetical protein